MINDICEAMNDAEEKAWKSLAGYKFLMFGYHAARWVNYNKLLKSYGAHSDAIKHSPFKQLVTAARAVCRSRYE